MPVYGTDIIQLERRSHAWSELPQLQAVVYVPGVCTRQAKKCVHIKAKVW